MSGRNMQGALFKAQNRKNEKSPEYTGSAMIDGAEYRIAGWRNEGNTGTYLSLKFTPKSESNHKPREPDDASF